MVLMTVGQGIVRQIRVIQVRKQRKINQSQRSIATGGRLPVDEVLPDALGHHHAPGAQSHIDRLAPKLRQEVGQSGWYLGRLELEDHAHHDRANEQ